MYVQQTQHPTCWTAPPGRVYHARTKEKTSVFGQPLVFSTHVSWWSWNISPTTKQYTYRAVWCAESPISNFWHSYPARLIQINESTSSIIQSFCLYRSSSIYQTEYGSIPSIWYCVFPVDGRSRATVSYTASWMERSEWSLMISSVSQWLWGKHSCR